MNFRNFFRFLCVLILKQIVLGRFSINYQPHQNFNADAKMMNFGASFKDSPSAEQVADIFARLSGKAPLLWEDQVNLPTVHSFQNSEAVAAPLLVEVQGGVLPASAVPVIRVHATSEHEVPSLTEVVASLKQNGITPETTTIKADEADIYNFLSKQARPVVILHNDGRDDFQQHRLLQTSTSNSTIPLSEFQISQYQICLWTGVLMFLLISFAICAVVQMDVVPDNILFAKFQSGRTDSKRD